MEFLIEQIQRMIYVIRGQKIMLDSDLAKLYGVETKRLNEQVRRNKERFPEDFMFECNKEELVLLRSQIATTNSINDWNYKRRTAPMLFTENGVAMLSTVLNSQRAIQVNMAIMRIFTKLRSYYLLEMNLSKKIGELEEDTNKMFKVVFERLDELETGLPALSPERTKIGLK